MPKLRKLPSPTAGFASYEAVFVIVVLIIVGLTGYFIFHETHTPAKAGPATQAQTSSTSKTGSSSYAVLSPATVPSKTPECSTPISFQSNGNSGPIQCANGDLNVTEWNALAALEPTVMSLGYGATPAQIQPALCSDANASDSDANTKNGDIVEATVYQITALYYGWNFSPSPSAVLSDGGC